MGDDWADKQDRLKAFLAAHGASEAPYRVDLEKGKVFWVDAQGLSLVVADCKVLLSYALTNRSILMAWANGSLAPGSSIPRQAGFPDSDGPCTPETVWDWTLRLAEQLGAEAVYRAPSPQNWVMLGLWRLRAGGAEQFFSGSPARHVVHVLELLGRHPSGPELAELLNNYAQSFLQLADHPHKHTAYEAPLRDTARVMRNALGWTSADKSSELQAELERLAAEWQERGRRQEADAPNPMGS